MKDLWLSVEDICKYLGVSKDTVYKWIDVGGMPAHRLGCLWKFKNNPVDAWVEAGGACRSIGSEEKNAWSQGIAKPILKWSRKSVR